MNCVFYQQFFLPKLFFKIYLLEIESKFFNRNWHRSYSHQKIWVRKISYHLCFFVLSLFKIYKTAFKKAFFTYTCFVFCYDSVFKSTKMNFFVAYYFLNQKFENFFINFSII